MALFGFFQPWKPYVETNYVLVPDGSGYHRLATSLVENQRFANGYFHPDEPESVRTPLYPLFIAFTYTIFGPKPWIVILAQIMIDTVTCLILLFLLSRLFSPIVAVIASVFYALNPQLILHASTKLLSEALFVFLIVTAFWFVWISSATDSQRSKWLFLILSSFFLGLATLTRPISQYILVCYFAFFLVAYWKHSRRIVTYSVLFMVIFVLTLFPWLWRNYRVLGSFSLSTSSSLNLLRQVVVPMEVKKHHESYQEVRRALFAEADQMIAEDSLRPEDLNTFQKAKYWRDLAFRYIRKDPAAFVKSYFMGLIYTLFGPGTSTYLSILKLPESRIEVQTYTNIRCCCLILQRSKGAWPNECGSAS